MSRVPLAFVGHRAGLINRKRVVVTTRKGAAQVGPHGVFVARKFWTCPKGCGGRWERSLVKCRTAGCAGRRPKARAPVHARTLRDDNYPVYRELNDLIHGPAFGGDWQPDNCGVCGSSPKGMRNMDRDHGHDRSESSFGRPRGLACPGDWGCNKVMSRLTLRRAREIVAYLERVEAYYARETAAGTAGAGDSFSAAPTSPDAGAAQ